MATLNDLELQESNNFIHIILGNGALPVLKLMDNQIILAANVGEVGTTIVQELQDSSTEIGKSYKRLQDLERDCREVMVATGMTVELAQAANSIFSRNLESFQNLNEKEKEVVEEYWMKKKACILGLTQKGYTFQELFS